MFNSVVLLGRAAVGLKTPIIRHIQQGRDPVSYSAAQLLEFLLTRASFDRQGRWDSGSGGAEKQGQERHG